MGAYQYVAVDTGGKEHRGVLEGDDWVITGQKVWTSNAHLADYMFILVRTEPEAPKHKGISYLLLDMKQPGVTIRPLKQMTGETGFNEVFLDAVRTPRDWIVGERGQGWEISRTTLKHERNSIGNADLVLLSNGTWMADLSPIDDVPDDTGALDTGPRELVRGACSCATGADPLALAALLAALLARRRR